MPAALAPWMRTAAVAAGLALCAAGAGARGADLFDAGIPFVRAYEVSDGVPQNTVHALLVDHEGLLWVGTQDGVARYDGRAWTDLELPSRERSNFARALLEASDGALWVATQGAGLLRWERGEWTVFDPAHGFPDERVNALAEATVGGEHLLFAATHSHGVLRWDGRVWRAWTKGDGLPADRIWDLLPVAGAHGTRLWLATEAGPAWVELDSGRVVVPPGAPADSASSLQTLPGAAGGDPEVFVGSYGGGLFRFAGGTWTRFGAAQGLPSQFVTDLAPRPGATGEFWVATDGGGLALWSAGGIAGVELGPKFSSRAVYRVLETTAAQGADAVWIGTRNNGLLRLTSGYWRSFVPFPEIPRSTVTAVLARDDAPGGPELWLGTDGYGLALWRGGEWRRFTAAAGALGHDSLLALAETRATGRGRRVWAGTRNGGLSAWDGERWTRYDRAHGTALPSDLVQTLLETVDETGRGRLWVGTREGLASFDGERWTAYGAEGGWPTSSVLALLDERDAAGRRSLWIGTSTGLYRWRDGVFRHWGAAEGLPNPTVHALFLRIQRAGRRQLWIGTDGGGAVVLDPDQDGARCKALADLGLPRLPNGVVYAIVEDAAGRLYLPTNRGVVRLTLARQPEEPELELLTVAHGLPASQASRGATVKDDRGRIWVGTVGGAAALDPAREPHDRAPKRILIEAALADGSGRTVRDAERLDYRARHLRFRYALLSFLGESATRYRTQLVGSEDVPTGWTASAEREFAAVPAGEYAFRVWGRDVAGRVSGPVELGFAILPAPWETVWARLAAFGAALVGVFLLLGARARAHERREGELEELVAARTTRLQRANALLIELSYVDSVTAIPNRRRFDELLAAEWKRATRGRASVGLVMIDIDRFKAYNDEQGHQRGDDCLRQVAAALADALSRSGDAICRYGGEEFAVILPSTDIEGAVRVAEHLRRKAESLAVRHPASDVAPVVTVSCGVAALVPEVGLEPEILVRAADRALYDAKHAGRNRVVAAG